MLPIQFKAPTSELSLTVFWRIYADNQYLVPDMQRPERPSGLSQAQLPEVVLANICGIFNAMMHHLGLALEIGVGVLALTWGHPLGFASKPSLEILA